MNNNETETGHRSRFAVGIALSFPACPRGVFDGAAPFGVALARVLRYRAALRCAPERHG